MLCAAFPAGAAETREYKVERGETLWSIAARRDVYADPYLWPVIYKFNRDQIEDPARIYPNQVLMLPLEIDAATREAARVEAGAPPVRGETVSP
jgi:nucleoid-associated protein YgaU